GPDVVLARNPKLVYGRMTGWGQEGPLANAAGHDINYISITGALAAIGTKEKPVPPLNLVGDFGGGALYLVVGVLAALLEASKSGKGQVVDTAMCDGAASLMSMFFDMTAIGRWKEGTDICFAPILTMAEAPKHPHMAARKVFVERHGVTQPAPAPRFSRTPSAIREAEKVDIAQLAGAWKR